MMTKAYLDSCIVIYLIEGPDSLSRQIQSALQPTDSEPPRLFFSDLTRLECRVGPLRKGDSGLLQRFDQLFSSEELQKIAIETPVFDLATELRGSHLAKTPDALHLAAAITGGCTEFWTNDGRLHAPAGNRITIRIFS
jgi:predicted nucleic acid-binding protein